MLFRRVCRLKQLERPAGQAFEKYNIGVKLANPLKTKAIAEAKIKTDTLDARTLAHLLRSDFSFFTISIP